MCGIFGAAFLGSESRANLRLALATAALHHRGPDGQGGYADDDVVFGHTRLKILDLSERANQPMKSEDGRIVMVFNGEIYNYVELRAELEQRGATFRSSSDTEILLEGYRVFGEHIVDRIHGMFAFCIWDKASQKLVLARDRTGKKPLFYSGDAHVGFRFGSSVQAIIASGQAATFDVDALPSFLVFGGARAPRTFFKGIFQLPPATLMVLERGKPSRTRRYWTPPFGKPPIPYDDDEAVTEFRRLFELSLKRRLRSDVPVGAFLSGGLDSSCVVAVMASMSPKPVRTYTLGFALDPAFDESHFARLVAHRFGTSHTELELTPQSFDTVERLIEMHDGPFGDSSAVPTAFISSIARRDVSVVLSGDGGDELFAGYKLFRAIENSERVPKQALRALQSLLELAPDHSTFSSTLAKGVHYTKRALLPMPEQLLGWQSHFGMQLDAVIHPDLLTSLPVDEPLRQSRELFGELPKATSPLAQMLYYNFMTYLPDDLLVKADRASMMHALEIRSPFLDTDLIEFAARLPDRLRRRGSTTKWLLRRAYGHMLPAELLRRRKMGFGVPLATWFRGDLRDYVQGHLDGSSPLYKYVRKGFVDGMLHEHFDKRIDRGLPLWALLTLSIWLKKHES